MAVKQAWVKSRTLDRDYFSVPDNDSSSAAAWRLITPVRMSERQWDSEMVYTAIVMAGDSYYASSPRLVSQRKDQSGRIITDSVLVRTDNLDAALRLPSVPMSELLGWAEKCFVDGNQNLNALERLLNAQPAPSRSDFQKIYSQGHDVYVRAPRIPSEFLFR